MTTVKRETQWNCHSLSFHSLNLNDLKFKNTECNQSRDQQERLKAETERKKHRPDDRKWKNDEKKKNNIMD